MESFWPYFKADIYQIGALTLAGCSLFSTAKSIQNWAQWRSISSAHELNESTIEALRRQPKKRLHVKLNGVLTSDSPMVVRNTEGEDVDLVYKQDWHGYTAGWSEALKTFVSVPSYGLNPRIVLTPSAQKLDGAHVKVSRRALEQAKGLQLLNTESKLLTSRIFATFYSFYLFNYPYLYTHRTYGLRKGSYVFAVMDAFVDDDGQVTICPPAQALSASVLTTDHEERYKNQRYNQFWRFTVAAGLFALSSALFQDLARKAR